VLGGTRQYGVTVAYETTKSQRVSASVYDLTGRCVARVFDGNVGGGKHYLQWNAKNQQGETVGAGVYFVRLKAGDQMVAQKFMILP